MTVNFSTNKKDADLIRRIVDRAILLFANENIPREWSKLEMQMDVTATHLNGTPLDLEKFLAGREYDFIHDINGIRRHLDRSTGRLGGFFYPRFSQPNHPAARA